MEPRTAIDLYPALVSLIVYSTTVASAMRVLISVEVILESSSTLIKVSSSKIYSSVDSVNIFRILFSMFLRVFLSSDIWMTILSR
jgi:hypothetical protein